MSSASDLRLQVVLNTIDKSSAVLKRIQGGGTAASKALKETRDKLKALEATQKSVGEFRELRTGLRGTAEALASAQAKAKSLAQQLHANGPPTKAMVRDFEAAKRSAAALGDQHQKQSQQVQVLRDRLTATGVSAGNLGTHERKLRADIAATNASIAAQQTALRNLGQAQQRYQKGMAAGRSIAVRGAVAGGTGMAMVHGLGAPIDESKQFITETQRIASLGLGSKITADAIAYGKAMKTYGTSTRDNLSLVRDGLTVFADLHHAELVAPTLARMKFANEAMYGNEQGHENEKKFMDMLKVIELRGGLESEAKFKDQADKIQRVITATGGRVQGEEWLNVIKTGGVAAKGLTDEALYYQMEPLVQEMGGHRVGTAMMSAYSNIYQGRTTKRAAMKLDELGLIGDKSKVKHDKVGQTAQLGVGALANSELFRENQFEWMEKVLLPKLKERGITEKQHVLDEIGGMFSNRTASNLFAQMYLQREQIHKNAQLNAGADSIDALYAKAKDGPAGKELELLARRKDAYKEIGDSIMPAYTRALEMGANALQSVTGFMREHATLAKAILIPLGILAVLLVVVGGAMLALSPLVAGFFMLNWAMVQAGTAGTLMSRVLGGAGTALRLVGTAIAWVGRALLMNPIGLAITGIAVAAFLLYKYWGPVSEFFAAMWEKIKSNFLATLMWFGQLPLTFYNAGADMIKGLANGITGALGFVRDAVTGAADSALSWFKEKLGIRSPSRVFMLAGADVSAGAALGISGGYGDVRRAAVGLGMAAAMSLPLMAAASPVGAEMSARLALAMGDAADQRRAAAGSGMTAPMSLPLASGTEPLRFDARAPLSAGVRGATAPVAGDTITITIQAAPGMDLKALARAVGDELDRRKRASQAQRQSSLTDYD